MTTDALSAAPQASSYRAPRLRSVFPAKAAASGRLHPTAYGVRPAFDQALAVVAVLLLLPLLIVIAAAIRLESPGPVVFRQRRLGLGNREFLVFKFRTMAWADDASCQDGRMQTQRGDSRVTRVGDFLRKSSLDELLQLFNVLNGTMSLVGPRPHPVAMRTQGQLCEELVPNYGQRHRVRPGITGWAQVNGHRGATETVEQLQRRVEHDLHYVEHRCFLFDLHIMLLTPIRIMLDRDNAF